jgi:hypothetical protein
LAGALVAAYKIDCEVGAYRLGDWLVEYKAQH